MLADVGAIAVTALLTQKLGGRPWAMFLAALAVFITPIFLAFSHLFTMNAFDPLLWTLLAWLIVDLIQTGNQRLWLWIGVLVGITLLNKYGVLFLIVGLLAGVIVSPLRRSLSPALVLGGNCAGHTHRAAEFPLAMALELSFCSVG